MSPVPPIYHAERPYGIVTHQHRCRRLKVEAKNVSRTWKVEKTYLQRARAAQPCRNDSKRLHRVVGPRRQRGRSKIESVNAKIERFNDKKQQNVERTHLGRENATQPPRNGSKRCRRVIGPKSRRGRIKIRPENVSQTRNSANTYLGRANTLQSFWRPTKGIRRLNKLTLESRMLGEPWRDDEDYG